MNFNGRQITVIAVLVVWSVACCLILSRWGQVSKYLSFIKMPMALQTSSQQAIGATTLKTNVSSETPPKDMSLKNPTKEKSDALHSADGTNSKKHAPLGDELALRVDAFTGGEAFREKSNQAPVRFGGVVERFSTSGLSRAKGFEVISQMHQQGLMDFSEAARYQVVDEMLTRLERELLAEGPVTDLTRVAVPTTTLLELAGGGKKTPAESRVKVGQNITVRVVLKDALRRPVLKGGHQVRVWMEGRDKKVPRSLAVDAIDLGNGTYMATIPILWPGPIEVKAALQRPREFNRLALSLMNIMKMINGIVASYVSGKKDEVTLCSFIPVVPGYHQVCNLTSLNGDLPWYCGRPSTPGIKCSDWAWSSYVAFPVRYPVSAAENALISTYMNGSAPCVRTVNNTLLLTAAPDPPKRPNPPRKAPCRPLTPRETWEDQSPRGYWDNKQWHTLRGCPLPQLSTSYVRNCLRNTTFLAWGDSNAIQAMLAVQAYTKCPELPDPQRSYHPNMLHVPRHFRCAQDNIILSWYPHAYPFYTGYGRWSDRKVKDSLRHILSRVPSKGKYVILMHLLVHFSQVHTYVYVQHVRDAARGVRELLHRNPEVKVIIRGPHALGGSAFCLFSDFHTERCFRVLRQEFRDLRDRVVLLNPWDMTVAVGNCDIHPSQEVLHAVRGLILQHVCRVR
ncbi:hypothetical protein ACOMHN_042955 [Nucella lapillus]